MNSNALKKNNTSNNECQFCFDNGYCDISTCGNEIDTNLTNNKMTNDNHHLRSNQVAKNQYDNNNSEININNINNNQSNPNSDMNDFNTLQTDTP